MANELISLNTNPRQEEMTNEQTQGLVSLSSDTDGLKVDPKVAQVRAMKADFAMGEDSPGIDRIQYALENGMEEIFRQEAVNKKVYSDRNRRLNYLQERMRETNGEMPLEEAETFQGLLSYDSLPDPETVVEEEYGRRYTETFLGQFNDPDNLDEALTENPELAHGIMDATQSAVTRVELGDRLLSELNQRNKDRGWGSWGLDIVEQIIPLMTYSNFVDAVKDAPTSSYLMGENALEQIQYLHLLPPKEFNQKLREAAEDIASSNLLDAIRFVEMVKSYPSSDQYWDDMMTVLDVADVASIAGTPVVMAVKGTRSGIQKLAVSAKAAVQSTSGTPSIQGAVAAAGDINGAARIGASARIVKLLDGSDPQGLLDEIRSDIQPLLRPASFLDNPGTLSSEAQRRLMEQAENTSSTLFKAIIKPGTVVRLDSPALQQAIKETERELKTNGLYNWNSDAVIRVNHIQQSDNKIGNVNAVEAIIGKNDATLFPSEDSARNFAENVHRIREPYQIVQEGNQFGIRITRTVGETSDEVNALRITADTATPIELKNMFIGAVRTPEDILSTSHNEARKQVAFGISEMNRLVMDAAKEIKLTGNEKTRFSRILDKNLNEFTTLPNGEKIRGTSYNTVEDLERAYQKEFGSNPTEREISAYFTFQKFYEWDYITRNFGIYKEKAAKGGKSYTIGGFTQRGEGVQVRARSTPIEGVLVDQLPLNSTTPFNFAMADPKTGQLTVKRSNRLTEAERGQLNELLSKGGAKAIQIFGDAKSADWFNKYNVKVPVKFVVASDVKQQALSAKQLPHRAGFHVDNTEQFYIKQQNIIQGNDGIRYYSGDTAAHAFKTRAEAVKFSKKYNEAVKLLKGNLDGSVTDKALKSFIHRNLPMTSIEELKNMFRQTAANGTDAPFDLDRPFFSIQRGERSTVSNALPEGVVDEANSPHNLMADINQKYTQERGEQLTTMTNLGTEQNPVMAYKGTSAIDALTVVNRSVGKMVQDRFLEDYKAREVGNYVQQFWDVFQNPNKGAMVNNPFAYLSNPRWNPNADPAKLSAAKNARQAIMSLMPQKNVVHSKVDYMKQRMVDGIYNRYGEKGVEMVPDWMLSTEKDPIKYMRAVAFHTKLGLFNPVQLFLQAQSFTHVAGIAGPRAAATSVPASWMMRTLRFTDDPAMIEKYADRISSVTLGGMNKPQFIESYNALRDSGFMNVAGEVATMDDIWGPPIFKGQVGEFLDKGTMFFKEGERFVRMSAWNASYVNWRKANPKASFDAAAQRSVLNRADLLSVNMSSASMNPMWQKGVLSVPTQFWSFQTRLAEQFLGKRLTAEEKIRAFATYSTVYGIPTAVGTVAPFGLPFSINEGGTAFTPFYEDVKRYALENGIDINDGVLDTLANGIGNTMLEAITGNEYNFAERYGPAGLSVLSDIIKGDQNVIETVFGAFGSTFLGFQAATDPLVTWAASHFHPDDEVYPLTVEDFTDALRDIASSADTALKGYTMMTVGKYISKNGTYIDDVEGIDGLFMALTGLSPREIPDAYIKVDSMNSWKAEKDKFQRRINENMAKMLKSDDPALQEKYSRRVTANFKGGDFTPDEAKRVMSEALRVNQSLVDSINERFQTTGPSATMIKRLEHAVREQQRKANTQGE